MNVTGPACAQFLVSLLCSSTALQDERPEASIVHVVDVSCEVSGRRGVSTRLVRPSRHNHRSSDTRSNDRLTVNLPPAEIVFDLLFCRVGYYPARENRDSSVRVADWWVAFGRGRQRTGRRRLEVGQVVEASWGSIVASRKRRLR